MKGSKLFIFLLVLVISLTSVTFADVLKYGSKGAEVTKLQKQLKKLGYFSGKATGYFGNITKSAVKKFQAGKGTAVDGIVGQQTTKALSAGGTSSRSSTSSTKNAAAKEALKKTQTILQKMGLYKGKVDGLYGKLTKAAVQQFQKKYGMKVTGVIDKTTESKILNHYATEASISRGSSSESVGQTSRIEAVKDGKNSKGKIEVLDWWKEANKVFSIGTKAKVIDVRSGKTFNIVRTYGGNHADCETATLKDSKIMKEVWGGNWSWTRRPVILEVGGRKLAASIAAMPHAGVDSQPANKILSSRSQGYGRGYNLDKVKNNGMSGVFDVHFLNSRTHGTNKVNAAHQKAIKEAAAAKL